MTRWRTVAAVDFDARAGVVYRANFPGVQVQCCRVEDAVLPAADVILAGFPCQPHSLAGERKASADERDGGDAFVAAIERVHPRMFLGENVAGILSSEGGKYVARLLSRMEALGYRVEVETLDAVDYGVPQFRERVWFWGIRNDVKAAHRWPARTHMDPAERGALFGDDLPPWVSCGEALGLCVYDAQNETVIGDWRPCGTIQGNAQEKGVGHYAIHRPRGFAAPADRNRPDHPVSEPSPTVDNHHSQASQLNVAVRPSTTLPTTDHHANAIPQYRYSDAMYAKHAPAAPAAPAPTVQAKWFKGGAEGLAEHPSGDGRTWASRHPVASPPAPAPAPAIRARSPRDGGRCTENVVAVDGTYLPTHTIFGEPVKWIRKGDVYMRRLSALECARLQSVPDDFVWPDSVSKSARYRIVGNGVACGIAVHLSRALAEADPESRTVLDLFCGGGLWACGWHGRAWEHRT